MTIDINRTAPASAEASGHIAAPPQVVWDILTDLENWSQWNAEVTAMDFRGPLAVGSHFTWKGGGATIHSELLEVSPPHRVAWAGRTFPGINAVHVWSFTPDDEGTMVHTAESFDGFVVRLMRSKMRKMLSDTLENGIRMLREAAELRAGTAK